MYRIKDNVECVTGEALHREILLLPQWRQEVVMRYKFEGGRRESALAFRLLQDMLREYRPGMDTSAIEFAVGEHGKPSLIGCPDIHFNISHCKYAVACAVDSRPVGIDIECRGRYKHSLAAYCMSPTEMEWIDGDDLRFTTLWTKKEALLKLLGTGITDDVKTILHHYEGMVDYDTTVADRYVCTLAQYKQQVLQ